MFDSASFRSWLHRRSGLLVILAGALYYGLYVHQTIVDVVALTSLEMAGFVGDALEGRLEWAHLWQPYREHGLFAYRVLLLINVALFGWSALFDAYVIALMVLITAILVFADFQRDVGGRRSAHAAALLFLPVAFVLFSVTQMVGQGMDVQVRLSIPAGLAAFMLLAHALRSDAQSLGLWAAVAVVAAVSILFLGTPYSAGWVVAFSWLLLTDVWKTRRLRLGCIVLCVVLLVAWVAYYFAYSIAAAIQARPFPTDLVVAKSWFDQAKFVVAALGSGLVSANTVDMLRLSDLSVLLNGAAALAIYVYAIARYFQGGMYRRTALPAALILYTLAVIGLILLGRPMAWKWGTADWYATQYRLGTAAVVWILVLDFFDRDRPRPLLRVFSAGAAIYVVAALLVSNVVEWRRAESTRAYFAGMESAFCLEETDMPVDAAGLTPFRLRLAKTTAALRILKNHRLNIRCDGSAKTPIGSSLQSALLVSGWHGEEGENRSRWMAATARARFKTGSRGHFVMNGFLPASLPAMQLDLSVDAQCRSQKTVQPGESFALECDAAKEAVIDVVVTCQGAIVPANIGLSADQRELCVIVGSAEAQ